MAFQAGFLLSSRGGARGFWPPPVFGGGPFSPFAWATEARASVSGGRRFEPTALSSRPLGALREVLLGHFLEGLDGAQDVIGEDGAGALGIAGHGGLAQALMLGVDIPGDGLVEQADAPIALRLLIEDVLEVADPAGRAGRDQHLVEGLVAGLPLLPGLIVGAQLLLGARQAVEGPQHRDRKSVV